MADVGIAEARCDRRARPGRAGVIALCTLVACAAQAQQQSAAPTGSHDTSRVVPNLMTGADDAHLASPSRTGDDSNRRIPALAASLDDPGDDRDWRLTTQIDGQTVTLSATAPGGVLAVVFRRVRRSHPSCSDHAAALFRTREIDPFRTLQPVVFRGTPWEPQVFHQRAGEYEVEFGCLRAGDDMWFASALAQPRASVGLLDLASVASRIARALLANSTRRDYPVRLDRAALDLADPGGDAAWLYLGNAPELLVPSDAFSSRAGDSGGVTVTAGRRTGNCPGAWQAMRPGLRNEGTLVDRPAYVPDVFGPRIRRIAIDDRLREIYCADTPAGALVITAIFRGDDGDAMTRLAPMLRAIARSAATP